MKSKKVSASAKFDNRPIGIFDSGLGGLTVVAAMKKALPNENIIYLGDTARVPYGDKSPANIIRFGIEDASFLVSKGVKLIVVACNTVSAIALQEIRAKFADVPVIGVLEAGVSACLKAKPRSVAVIGTRATASSDSYRRGIHAVDHGISIRTIACPLFVPIVEEGLADNEISRLTIEFYLKPLKKELPDMLLLACTHYPLLKKSLQNFLSKKVRIVDSAEACAKFAEEYLKKNSLSASKSSTGTERFYVTDMPDSFFKQAKKFLGRDLEHFQKVSISEN